MLKLQNVFLDVFDGDEKTSILKDISIEFESGKVYVITGPNGGGKTSLARLIMGLYKTASGTLTLDGENITDLAIDERAKRGVRYAFQNPPRFKGITVHEFLKMAHPNIDEVGLHSMLAQIGLCPELYLGRAVDAKLSGGEMKRIEVASALQPDTKIAILDEPEAGVDLWGFEQMREFVSRSCKMASQRTTLIISHNERFLEMADEIIVVADGVIQERGKLDKIKSLIDAGSNCQWRKICPGREQNANCN